MIEADVLASEVGQLKLCYGPCVLMLMTLSLHAQAKEERMVEADVLALEVKRLRAALASVAEQVFGLENRKEQLRFSMQERKHEIEVGCCLMHMIKGLCDLILHSS